MPTDPYAVLGVSRDASQEDIKKAYRALSKEWHPDRHKGDSNAEKRFKEINEAYELIGQPEKRKRFDQFGFAQGQGGAGFDFSSFGNASDLGDLFENFFGGRARSPMSDAGADREVQVTVDLAEAVQGVDIPVRVRRMVACTTCDATGAAKGSKIITCTTCGGTGQVDRTVQSFFGQIRQRSVCTVCGGSGTVPEQPCSTCSGQGRVQEDSDLSVHIPAGIDDGQSLRLSGQGDAGGRNGAAGDLYVRVRVRRDPRFEREGDTIRTTVDVPVVDALLGGRVQVETVHGTATIDVPAGTQPGSVLRLKGKGMPIIGRSSHGDHYVTLRIVIPKKLSRKEKQIVEQWKAEREE